MNNLYNSNYLQQLCRLYYLKPSKKYGQNFLINPEPIQQITKAAELSNKDMIIEIGPGFGILTLALLEQAGRVVAYEIEKKLEKYWQDILSRIPASKLKMVWGNILNIKHELPHSDYKVVANLPYQITSNLIRRFLTADQPPKLMVLMVQAEVAERICAQPGQMSLLSVAVQYYAKPMMVMKVPRTYFWPSPKVDSAIIKLEIKSDKNLKVNSQRFFRLVKSGFANPRKLLVSNLASLLAKDKTLQIFRQVGLEERVRAQELSMEQWKKIFIHTVF